MKALKRLRTYLFTPAESPYERDCRERAATRKPRRCLNEAAHKLPR